MNEPEIAKFCAGATIDGRNVESIHPTARNATTATPAAIPGKLAGDRINQFDMWAVFALMVVCFAMVVVDDKVRG